MGRLPAVVIVVRHGARLDAADPKWHLTSPTPYDPPLTYGGWKQAQALGGRIGSILYAQGDAASPISSDPHLAENVILSNQGAQGKRQGRNSENKRLKVRIHTSPYTRCIQTSIAISAGMAQYQATSLQRDYKISSKPPHVLHSGSPYTNALYDQDSSHLYSIPEPGLSISLKDDQFSLDTTEFRRMLRVDAFLGEWLSPEYFENITPPPDSKMMVASAKADLLRRGDPVETAQSSGGNQIGNFPGGWSSDRITQASGQDSSNFGMNSSGPLTLEPSPRIGRAQSHSSISVGKKPASAANGRMDKGSTIEKSESGYVAPIPPFAVSPSQPIPQGYVTHARNACVEVDFQWDSMRPPLEWGGGGEYGEEWSSMHRRYRYGLFEMIEWYRKHGSLDTLKITSDNETLPLEEDREDDNTEIILILVTHGAGCNALIGALTNQPVLIDVGMASLTMAVRKSVDITNLKSSRSRISGSPPARRRSEVDYAVSDEYEVKILASADHLRHGSEFLTPAVPKIKRAPSLPIREKSPYRYERPGFLARHPPHPATKRHEPQSQLSPTRSLSKLSLAEMPNEIDSVKNFSGGLWSKPASAKLDRSTDLGAKETLPTASDFDQHPRMSENILNGNVKFVSRPKVIDNQRAKSFSDHDHQNDSVIPTGLWGTAPQALAVERGNGPKRRWTLSQAA